MSRLDRLTVRGFKSIRELEDFEPRSLNILIGPNGSGKTNFIDLFRMLARMQDGRLQIFVAEQDGPDSLMFRGTRRSRWIEVEFAFGQNGYRFALTPAGTRLIFRYEYADFYYAHEKYSHTLGSSHDESKLTHAVHKRDSFAPYVQNSIAGWRVYHFHDTSVSAPVRQACALRDNRRLKADAGNLASFLRLLREHHGDHFRKIVEVIQLAAPFFGDFIYREEVNERLELEWRHLDDPDTTLGPRQLSDGTLRFICLATLLLQPAHLQPDLILIDEPELGLHPYALTLLAEMLRHASDARQVIVSTQSAELVSELEPEDIVVVNRKNGESVFERLASDRLMVWLKEYSLGDLWKMNVFGKRFDQ